MKKSLLAALLSAVMVLGMLPAMALPALAAEAFDYTVTADGRSYTPEDDRLLLPGSVDLDAVSIFWEGNDWTVKQGQTTLNSGDVLDLSGGAAALTVKKGDGAESTVTISAMKGAQDIPALYVAFDDSEGFSDMHARKGNEADVAVTLLGGDDSLTDAVAEMKGRGNVSWDRAKKSYQIKLDKKADVLGMGKSKKWILVPSSYDLSMVRTAVGFELAQGLDMEFAGNYRYVDLYMDGRYYGLYILCEKVEVGENRIDITNLDDAVEEAAGKDVLLSEADATYSEDGSYATVGSKTIDLTGGYHLEFDNYDESTYQFTTEHGCKVTMKEPEALSDGSDLATGEAYKYIKSYVQAAEDAIYQTDAQVLREYFDLESFAKMWLLKEFISDYDATRNMHFWKESDLDGDGKLHAGLAWDFDNSMDRDKTRATTANDQKITTSSDGSAKCLSRLLRHDAFKEELVRQYTLYKDLFTTVDGTSPLHTLAAEWSEAFADSSRMDTLRWSGTGNYCSIHNFKDSDRATSLKVVQDFILTRNTYLEKRMEDLGTTLYAVTFMDKKNGTEQVIPVGSTGLQTLPVPEEVEGFAFDGWYAGEDRLEPGEAVTGEKTLTAKWVITELPMTDVEEGTFYYDAVLWAVENEITTGTTSTTFSPNDDCTRGQVVTFLWRSAGSPEPGMTDNPFTDVEEDDYCYRAVLWAVEKGITVGTSDTTFGPDETCTRAHAVTFLWRSAEKPESGITDNPFEDVRSSKYYLEAVLWAVENGITKGDGSATIFNPNGTCTRGQIVTFLYRFMG